jgi:hypothetical protein
MSNWNDVDYFELTDGDGAHEDDRIDEDLDEAENFDWLTDDLVDYLFPKIN